MVFFPRRSMCDFVNRPYFEYVVVVVVKLLFSNIRILHTHLYITFTQIYYRNNISDSRKNQLEQQLLYILYSVVCTKMSIV